MFARDPAKRPTARQVCKLLNVKVPNPPDTIISLAMTEEEKKAMKPEQGSSSTAELPPGVEVVDGIIDFTGEEFSKLPPIVQIIINTHQLIQFSILQNFKN